MSSNHIWVPRATKNMPSSVATTWGVVCVRCHEQQPPGAQLDTECALVPSPFPFHPLKEEADSCGPMVCARVKGHPGSHMSREEWESASKPVTPDCELVKTFWDKEDELKEEPDDIESPEVSECLTDAERNR